MKKLLVISAIILGLIPQAQAAKLRAKHSLPSFPMAQFVQFSGYGPLTWGLDRTTSPNKIGINLSGTWTQIGTWDGETLSFFATASITPPDYAALGGVFAKDTTAHQWFNSLDTDGNFTSSQPACADISDAAASCATDATNMDNAASGTLATGRGGTGVTDLTWSGTTHKAGSVSGSTVNGQCAKWDANGNLVSLDCGGGGSGTVSNGNGGELPYYATTGTTVAGNPNFTVSNGIMKFGITGSVAGGMDIAGSTSGLISFRALAAAGTYNWNWPNTAGVAGQFFTSGGGGLNPNTWTTPGTAATKNTGTSGNTIPLLDGTNTWSAAQTINSLVSTQLPNLSSNVQGTGMAGLNGGKWMIWESGAWEEGPALRVDRHMNSGTGLTNHTYKGIWANCSTNPNNVGYEWCGTFQLSNDTLGSTAAQNVALNATAFKESNGLTGDIGPTWASNFNCTDRSGENNPVYSCIGSEIDAYVAHPSSTATTDTGKKRVILQLASRSNADNTHIGRGIFLNADTHTILDNAIEIQNRDLHNTFLVLGNGATTISSDEGNWGSINVGKNLIVKPETSGGTNPALGVLDSTSSNGWAILNAAGQLRIAAMPALSDSSTAPINGITFEHATGAATLNAQLKLKTYTIATLPTCNSSLLGSIAIISNGRNYATDAYGADLTSASTVTRMVLCTNKVGATTYAWQYN